MQGGLSSQELPISMINIKAQPLIKYVEAPVFHILHKLSGVVGRDSGILNTTANCDGPAFTV